MPNRFEARRRTTQWLLLLVATLFAEGLLRLLDPSPFAFVHQARQVHRYSRTWGVDLVPSTSAHLRLSGERAGDDLLNFIVTTNAFGFRGFDRPRDHGFAGSREPGVRYLHALGDSYTMGWGVDHSASYPAVLEWLLPEGFRVLNLGVDGYGTLAATEKSIALAPQFPIWHAVYLFSPNDLEDDERALAVRRRSVPIHWAFESLDLLRRHSYLANAPFALKWGLFFRGAGRAGASPPVAERLAQVRTEGLLVAPPARLTPFRHPSLEAIDAYARFVEAQGGRLTVLVLSRQPQSAAFYWHCRDRGFDARVIELPPELRLHQDGHFNQVGGHSLAKLVLEQVLSARLAEAR